MKNNQKSVPESFQEPNQIKVIDSPYQDLYLHSITIFSQHSIQFRNILQQLRENEFNYSKQYAFEFSAKIVKSSKDSIKYEIEFGNFRTYISTINVPFDFRKIQRQQIGRGRYGKILQFKFQEEIIVAKQFQIENCSDIYEVLRQIFLAKLASVLKIGPKFKNYYGYDLICLKETCQYLMEKCEPLDLHRIEQEVIHNKVKYTLQILHSFHVIHGDLKPSHFFWSSQSQTIVVLDFGMARFIQEDIGQMTLTNYFGTYDYCCQQMKKSYLLKSPFYVDLYYNDLYALEKCKQSLSISFIDTCQNQQKGEWGFVINLFQLKFLIFEENLKDLRILYQNQQYLVRCFHKIIKEQQKIIFNKIDFKFQDSLKNSSFDFQSINDQTSVDQIVYLELLKNDNTPKLYNIQLSFIRIKWMYQHNILENFLELNQTMDMFFEIIFQHKQFSSIQASHRKQIIKYIFLIKTKRLFESRHQIMVKQVLLVFQEYFYETGNIPKLKNIEDIFKLTCQFKDLKKVQANICQTFLRNPNLWLQFCIKEIFWFDHRQNIRKQWLWQLTNKQLREKFLTSQQFQFLDYFVGIIVLVDKKGSSDFIGLPSNNISIDQIVGQYSLSLNSQKHQLQKFYNNINNKNEHVSCEPSSNSLFKRNEVENLRKVLERGTIKWQEQKQYLRYLQALRCLNFLSRQTVWTLAHYCRVKNIWAFQRCLELIFDDIFVFDACQGLNMFAQFQFILEIISKISPKTKQLFLKYVQNIQISQILKQIKDDPFSFKELILNFLQTSSLFFNNKLIGNQKQKAQDNLKTIFQQISSYFSENSSKWWAVESSEIFLLMQITTFFYEATENGQWVEGINKMLKLVQKIYHKQYSQEIKIFFVQTVVRIINDQNLRFSINSICEIVVGLEQSPIKFRILSTNLNLFNRIIRKLCSKQLYENCLFLLEEYGRYAKDEYFYFNNSSLYVFSSFVEILSQQAIHSLFVKRIVEYKFLRIANSPRLSFILLFVFDYKPFLFEAKEKLRLLKLVCFGLSKIQIRYDNFSQVNSRLLNIYRLSTNFKNKRQEVRLSQDETLFKKNLSMKQKQYHKIGLKKALDVCGLCSLKKINQMHKNYCFQNI